jgi:hypothetical protein
VPQARIGAVTSDDLVAVAHQSEEHPFWLHLDRHDCERRPGPALRFTRADDGNPNWYPDVVVGAQSAWPVRESRVGLI